MKTAVSTKGQIVLPAEIRRQGDIVRLSPPRNQGLMDWLLACPEKGFFVPIESESTDTL
jgi:hypothetical protein